MYVPYQPDGSRRPTDRVQGQQGENGQTQNQQGQMTPNTSGGSSSVPVGDALPEYQRAAGEALDRSTIPPHMKGYVRDYFSELDPSR